MHAAPYRTSRILPAIVMAIALMVPVHQAEARIVSGSETLVAAPPPTLAQDLQVADTYWQQQGAPAPSCGTPTIQLAPLPAPTGGEVWTDATQPCLILITNAPTRPSLRCMYVVHEDGHLRFGPTYFIASNPEDPAHSPDPSSPMYYSVGATNMIPACAALDQVRYVVVSHAYHLNASRPRATKLKRSSQ